VVGQPKMDIGSNDNEFWYWISEIRPPYVYHCSYAEMARGGVRLPFPFQPEMVMAALGMAEYDPNKPYRIKESPQYLELTEETISTDGKPVDKVVVFNRLQVTRPGQPQVVAHKLIDKQGKVICQAVVSQVTVNQETGAVVPQRVTLSWPELKMQMVLTLDRPQVRAFDAQSTGRLFQRTNLTHQTFDLARQAVDGAGLQRAGFR
jgi:hypothetical protein